MAAPLERGGNEDDTGTPTGCSQKVGSGLFLLSAPTFVFDTLNAHEDSLRRGTSVQLLDKIILKMLFTGEAGI